MELIKLATKMINVGTGQPSAYFPLRINNKSQTQETNSVVPIKFPSTRNVLWESKPVGDFETLALILDKQVVQLFIVEKSLRLAHRYAEDRRLTSFLLGSVYPKSGESGVCFGVDRFDPGREITEKIGENVTKSKVPTAVVPGDHIIPITVKQELLTLDDSISHTKDEFTRAIQIIEGKICGKDVLTLSHVVSLKANLYCCRKQDELIIALHCGAIVPDSKFQARPIAPLPIIPTTLARNLAGPLRLSDVEGTPKMGYVTMDQTRKLLLLLESDPKVYNLPLIGIWISGVHNVHHPYVWASCLRYLYCREMKDRVLHSSGSFLLLHYSIMQKIPDFWECFLDNKEKLDFELLSCQENLHLDLDDCSSKEPLCFHLTPSPTRMNKILFDEAIAEWKKDRNTLRDIEQNVRVDQNNSYSKSSGFKNDENPRPCPSPHPSSTQVKSPNAPAQEESLSLSFDEGSNNFVNKHSEQTRENTKTLLAPRFKQTPNPTKPGPNKSDSFKLSRQPFKQITPQDQGNSPNSFLNRGKPVLESRNQENRKGEDKENTPLTSRNIPQGNVNQKSLSGGTRENTVPFSERNNNVPRRQSVGNHHQKALSGQNSSNPRVPVKVKQFGKRKRYRSEDVQSYEVQQPDELLRIRRNSHSSFALSDDDDLSDISLDSSFTKNNEVRCSSNHSPSTLNQFNQPSPNHSPKTLPSNSEYLPGTRTSKPPVDRPYSDCISDQPSKSDSCNLNHQSPRDDVNRTNQSNANTRQNSPKVSGNVRRSSPLPQSNNLQRSLISNNPQRQYSNDRNLQLTNPDIPQCTRITSNSGRHSFAGRSPQHCNRDTAQERISIDMRQPSPKNSDNGTPVVYHGNPHLGNNLRQGDSSHIFHTSNNMPGVQKGIVRMTTDQPSDSQPVMFAKSGDMTNQCCDIDAEASQTKYGDMMKASASNAGRTFEFFSAASYHQESDKNARNSIQQQSPNICNDTTHQISSNRVSNHHGNSQQSPSYVNHASHRPKPETILTPIDSEITNVEAQENARHVVQLKKEYLEKLASSKQLEEQVKKQEDMLRVLQEQVRSLLQIKEATSSEDDRPSLPLTPASTPVSTHENGGRLSHRASPGIQEGQNASLDSRREPERLTIGVNTGAASLQEGQNASQAVDNRREPERVTIGVNTGASLLWERPRDGCENCCKCKKSEPEQIHQGALDNTEPPEHPDVFLTPEKTESLISPSQVDVQADSTRNSTPAISNMMISSMSAGDDSLLNDQAVSTSQAQESASEGREFYDKLLCQVKDLLSEQVSTKQEDSTEERQHTSQSAQVPTREVVVKATLKQLEKIKHSEQDVCQQSSRRLELTESSSVFSTHRRSLSTSFIPEHPRLNYVSMSIDDTFDEVTYIDEMALKYLSDEEIKRFKSELRPSTAAVKRSFTRTVRFGSLPSDNERRSLSRRNLREVDFTWNNLSFCTKNYLTKYNLVEGHVSFTGEGDGQASTPYQKENSPETSIEPCKPPFPSPARNSEESSDILDIKRLKNLPKLF